MAEELSQLEGAIVDFYRSEIRRRYQLKNIRRFKQFETVNDAQVKVLRGYFLEHIYPPSKERPRLDDALLRMGDVIKSPRRLRPLAGAVIASAWRMGASLPSAISAGTSTLDAYFEARRMEAMMLQTAERIGLGPEDGGNREAMIQIIADVPEKEILRLIRDILKLFRALSNTKMLQTAVAFLDRCAAIMTSKPELYLPAEVEGIQLGRKMVQGGLDLFLQLEPKQFPLIISGIEEVELDWYGRVTKEAV